MPWNVGDVFSPSKKALWHKEVNSNSISVFLSYGQSESDFAAQLRASTGAFLAVDGVTPLYPSPQTDKKLCRLVDEYAKKHGSKDVAVVACFSYLSLSIAARYLISLQNLEMVRYLRCVTIAHRMNPEVVSWAEHEAAEALLRLFVSPPTLDVTPLQTVIKHVAQLQTASFVDFSVVHRAIEQAGFFRRFEARLEELRERRQYQSAHSMVSWLMSPGNTEFTNGAAMILAPHFNSWKAWASWSPNWGRIQLWENHPFLTQPQRQRLMNCFDLEGPDTATGLFGTLKQSPRRVTFVGMSPSTYDGFESLLSTLDHTLIAPCGSAGIDFFISLCVDEPASDVRLKYVRAVLARNDRALCKDLLLLRGFLNVQASGARARNRPGETLSDNGVEGSSADAYLTGRYEDLGLPPAVPAAASSTIEDRIASLTAILQAPSFARNIGLVPVDKVSTAVQDVLLQAGAQLLEDLGEGAGETVAIHIQSFADAAANCTWLPPALLEQLATWARDLPIEECIKGFFYQLRRFEFAGRISQRIKAYLSQKLVYFLRDDPIDSLLQQEMHFWSCYPHDDRAEVARTLSEIESLAYESYVTCLISQSETLNLSDVRQLSAALQPPTHAEGIISFAHFLNNPFMTIDICWKYVFLAKFETENDNYLSNLANSIPSKDWMAFVSDVCQVMAFADDLLPKDGKGITKQLLSWWNKLYRDYGHAVELLLTTREMSMDLLYLKEAEGLENFMGIIQNLRPPTLLQRRTLGYLKISASQSDEVGHCLLTMSSMSELGEKAVNRILDRYEEWPAEGLACLIQGLAQTTFPCSEDISVIHTLGVVLGLQPVLSENALGSAAQQLQLSYLAVLKRGRDLEQMRIRLERKGSTSLQAALKSEGIHSSDGLRIVDPEVPEDIADSCEEVGEQTYELCFPLTALNELQRQARGIPPGVNLLIIRITLKQEISFCIHLSTDPVISDHRAWSSGGQMPDRIICDANSSLFTYWVGRNVHQLVSSHKPTKAGNGGNGFFRWFYDNLPAASADKESNGNSYLMAVHTGITKLITSPPSTCVTCCGDLGASVWKPTTCSPQCGTNFNKAPLEAKLHNLLIDPDAVDLLLTCVYIAAADTSALDLLPGCPIPKNQIRAVIDSFPPLASLTSAAHLAGAIWGTDHHSKQRVDLLSWLCIAFRGFLVSAPDGWRIPSMPNSRQFMMVNSLPERQQAFSTQLGSGTSGCVFHGTYPTRLFLILTEGLKVMSSTAFETHGHAAGSGVYCGEDQATSWGYSGSTGQSWRHSTMSNMRIMLGCELAAHATPGYNYHVVANADRLLVRYVFLLPENYASPPRRHVDQAMHSAFSRLRTGA